jgi:hypothetical protein
MEDNNQLDIQPVIENRKKLIIGSERMFLNSYNHHLLNELKDEHTVFLLDDDYRYSKSQQDCTREIYNNVSLHWKLPYGYRTFIGYEEDCYFLFSLGLKYRLYFDAAFFVNYPGNSSITSLNKDYIQQWRDTQPTTKIYNLYSSGLMNDGHECDLAQVNQQITSRVPLRYSKRLAQEIAGILTYGVYQQNFLENKPSVFKMVSMSV